MIKSKLMALLVTLDPKEMLAFRQFLDSPFFNTREQPKLFFDLLYRDHFLWQPLLRRWHHPDWVLSPEEERQLQVILSKEKIDQEMFPGERFNDARIRRMMSDCYRHLEEFLFQLSLREGGARKEELRERAILERHFARGEFAHMERRLDRAERDRKGRKFKDMAYYRFGFEIAELKNSWLIRSSGQRDAFREMTDNLHTYYALSFMKYYASMMTRERVMGQLYEYPHLADLSGKVEEGIGAETPLMLAYHHVLQIEQEINPWESYRSLEKLIDEEEAAVPPDELRQIYSFMLNFLVRESRKPRQRYHAEMLVLFKKMLEGGMVYIKGKLSPRIFNQVVQAGCLAGEFDWVESFIFEHSDLIVGGEGREIVELAFLVLHFFRKNYERVYKGLDRIRFSTPSLQVQKRCLKLKACYEMGKSEEFFRGLDALRHFLRENTELGAGSVRLYHEFSIWAGRLGRNRFNHANPKVLSQESVADLEATSTYDKFWLLEKALQP